MRRIGLNTMARNAVLLGVTATVSACFHSTETVFTRQNQAAAALAMMGIEAEAQNLANLDMIYAAETQLHEACAPLRTVALRQINGEAAGIGPALRAMFTLDRCATKTDEVESFIRLEAPPIARLYLGPKSAEQQHQ